MRKKTAKKSQDKVLDSKNQTKKKHENKELDEALKETFPASDSTAKY